MRKQWKLVKNMKTIKINKKCYIESLIQIHTCHWFQVFPKIRCHITIWVFQDVFKSQSVISIRIRSYFGPHFPAFGLNIIFQSECGKIRTRINPNTYMSLISGISQNKMPYYNLSFSKDFLKSYCIKSVRIRSYSGPHFPHSDWIQRDKKALNFDETSCK